MNGSRSDEEDRVFNLSFPDNKGAFRKFLLLGKVFCKQLVDLHFVEARKDWMFLNEFPPVECLHGFTLPKGLCPSVLQQKSQ